MHVVRPLRAAAGVVLLLLLAVPIRAVTVDERVMEACLKLYVHGVSAEIAAREVGTEGIPVLLRLLDDPTFPRRDNVVAFLWQLAGGEATDALVELMTNPPAGLDDPEEDRALRLAPEALGQIAGRGDAKALDVLLAITDPATRGGPLAMMTVPGRDPGTYRDVLVKRAYRGLAFSGSATARSRLAAIATARAATDAATTREASQALRVFDEGTPASHDVDGGAATHGRAVSPLGDAQSDVHETPMTYANHVEAGAPMSDANVDDLLTTATSMMGRADGGTDVACCVTFTRGAPGGTFGTIGDGLDTIDTQAEFDAAATAPGGRLKVVNSISWCGSLLPNILGCAYLPGVGGVVVRYGSGDGESVLWMHEYGHNAGLGHSPDGCHIMSPVLYACNAQVSQSECNVYHAPFAGGTVDVGSCVDGDVDDVHDYIDNCPAAANTSQADSDFDGVGDACDAPCGNGVTEPTEECDDGNAINDDGCTNQCRLCGNGVQSPPEECDDGNAVPGDGCTNSCTLCGDGMPRLGDECDDGNLLPNDGCTADCHLQYCGNDVVELGEECEGDDIGENGCLVYCTICGNGTLTHREECDDGNLIPNDGCNAFCTICGNGVVRPFFEGCDDGNLTAGDGCSPSCRVEGCSSGEVDPGEECDDGNFVDTDGCTNGCTICGNGATAGPEQCDDGNLVADDGCTAGCTICGNGVATPPEQCDDGNLIDGDGCDADCTAGTYDACAAPTVIPAAGGTFNGTTSGAGLFSGNCGDSNAGPERAFQWTPAVSGVATIATCGSAFDTVLYVRSGSCAAGPQGACNDDGCGFQSTTSPLVTAGVTYFIIVDGYYANSGGSFTLQVTAPAPINVCGDGTAAGGEECDDGNAIDDDGCTNACTVCGNDVVTYPEVCDDGNLVDGDGCSAACTSACAPAPLVGCRLPIAPGKASFQLKRNGDAFKNQLKWKWGSGAATPKADYGAPTVDDAYLFCVYDGGGNVITAYVPAAGLCFGGKLCWAEKPKAFQYRNKHAIPDGVDKIDLKEGLAGKAKIGVSGRGDLLEMPDLTALTTPVRVQLVRPGGPCWEASFSAPFGKQDSAQFKDKSD